MEKRRETSHNEIAHNKNTHRVPTIGLLPEKTRFCFDQKVENFLSCSAALMEWFQRHRRDLPWRNEVVLTDDFGKMKRIGRDVYRTWVSELMLQQTQVSTVIPYFLRWMNRFPTLEDLSQATEDEVMAYWAGLGYYSRARNFHRAAQEVVAAGKFPTTREEWCNLPGVGPYTASAVLSLAQGQPVGLVDANVERVFSRFFLLSPENSREQNTFQNNEIEKKRVQSKVKRKIKSKAKSRVQEVGEAGWKNQRALYLKTLWSLADSLVSRMPQSALSDRLQNKLPATLLGRKPRALTQGPRTLSEGPFTLNEALMELGALICKPKAPLCKQCPIRGHCAAFILNKVELFPVKIKRPVVKKMEEKRVAYLTASLRQSKFKRGQLKQGKYLWVEKIPQGKWRAGLYDLPLLEKKATIIGKFRGEISSRSTVTNHQIFRKTEIRVLEAQEANNLAQKNKSGHWVLLEKNPEEEVRPEKRAQTRVSSHSNQKPDSSQKGLSAAVRKDLEKLQLFLDLDPEDFCDRPCAPPWSHFGDLLAECQPHSD